MVREDFPFLNFSDDDQMDEALLLFEEEIEAWDIDLRVVRYPFHNDDRFIEDDTQEPLPGTAFGSYWDPRKERNVIYIPYGVSMSHDAFCCIVAHELGHVALDHASWRWEELNKEDVSLNPMDIINHEFEADAWAQDFLQNTLMWSSTRYWDAQRALSEYLRDEVGTAHFNAIFWITAPTHPDGLKRWMNLIQFEETGKVVYITDNGDGLTGTYQVEPMIDCDHPTTWAGWDQILMNKQDRRHLMPIGTESEAHDWMEVKQFKHRFQQFLEMHLIMGEDRWEATKRLLKESAVMVGDKRWYPQAEKELLKEQRELYEIGEPAGLPSMDVLMDMLQIMAPGYVSKDVYSYYRNSRVGSHLLIDCEPMVADAYLRDNMPGLLLDDDNDGCQCYTSADTHVGWDILLGNVKACCEDMDESAIIIELGKSERDFYTAVAKNSLEDLISDEEWDAMIEEVGPWGLEEGDDELTTEERYKILREYIDMCNGIVICEGCFADLHDGEDMIILTNSGHIVCEECAREWEDVNHE